MTTAGGATGDGVPAKAVFYLTNRFNVLHILGSSFLGPRSWYEKYYTDLLEWSPVRLPIFDGSIPASASELVSAESDDAFPVAVELTREGVVDNSAPYLQEAAEEESPLGDAAWKLVTCSGCIPIADVCRIHFRSPQDLEEFEVREYENIPSQLVRRVVTPELFVGPALTADRLKAWLAQLPKEDVLQSEAFESIDRILGALNVVASACTGRQAELEWLKSLLTGTEVQAKSEAPLWINRATLRGERMKPQRGIPAADRELFPAAMAVLRRVHAAREWRPMEILREIEERVTSAGLGKKDGTDLDKALKRAATLVRNEDAFRPFKVGSGMPAAKALIMVLMRPDPQQVLDWPSEESGADLKTRLAAAALVGSLWGHTRLPVGIRSASMDRFLSAVGLLELGETAGAERVRRYSPIDVQVETVKTAEDSRTGRLLWRGDELMSRPMQDSSLSQLCEAADDVKLAVICERLGWGDCVGFTIELRGEASAVQTSHPEPAATVLSGHGIPKLKLAADRERVAAKLEGLSDESTEAKTIRNLLNESVADNG
jgi:hypothetical protein